ncbi:Predicted arabinose efflux permease, MFS family [Microvirga guangxiensis]|uniref:Predicted arabinose efflux permease, MFS family n=2 Tax=Microvirga guangxiensis TaxID=549386 RepID=A0A1G5JWT9_9HYPH|nr:Predicted arabinose efflux permease, MFS family [Microvirga guangxiensis]
MSNPVSESLASDPAMPKPCPRVVISALGITQILAWGSSFYLPTVLAHPIASDTRWSLGWVVGGLSVGLLAAGLVAPRVGRTIDARGGRPVLVASSVLLAAGLATLALAHSLPVYLMAWLVMGLGMGSGLYDAGFATLGRLHGKDARRAITTLTLWGGFASTVCWPLSAWLVEHFGWRGACAAYAAIHVLVCLPLHAFVVPGIGSVAAVGRASGAKPGISSPPPLTGTKRIRAFALLATILTLGAVTASMIGVHLLTFLQARGLGLAAAGGLGALVGPSQVGARVIEMAFGRHYHPIWTMAASVTLVAGGVILLLLGFPILALALALYGAGNGIGSIAKGTLPLALFGPDGYASLMGKLAMPSLLAQALSPSIGAILIEWSGPGAALGFLAGMTCLNIALVGLLWVTTRGS